MTVTIVVIYHLRLYSRDGYTDFSYEKVSLAGHLCHEWQLAPKCAPIVVIAVLHDLKPYNLYRFLPVIFYHATRKAERIEKSSKIKRI
jgi:hypothetical protein